MERSAGIVLTVLLLCGMCRSQTLWDAIKASTAPIGQFKKLVEDTKLEAFINEPKTAVFPPIDAAIAKAFPSGLPANQADKVNLVKYHLATLKNKDDENVIIKTNALTDNTIKKSGSDGVGVGKYVTLTSMYNNVRLYMVRSKNDTSSAYEYFVNNAKFDVGNFDKTAADGSFHVVDEVIYPLGLHDALYPYLKDKSNCKTFYDLITKFKGYVSTMNPTQSKLQNRFELTSYTSTIFVPNNAAFAPIPATVMDGIKNNLTKLGEFLGSHLAPDQVIFSSWMAYRPEVKMDMYVKRMGQSINSSMYLNQDSKQTFVSAGGVTAKVEGNTQPIGNGLMLIINTPLNLLYRNVRVILQSEASAFLTACDKIPDCKKYIDGENGEVTVFAPQSFPSSLATALSADELKTVVMLHLLPSRRLTIATMPVSQVVLEGAMQSGKLRFNRMTAGTWVEGRLTSLVGGHYSQGFVGSQIQKADVAGTDGVVQVLRSHLGYPTNSIHQILRNRYSQFSKVIGYLDDGFDIDFKTLNADKQRYTFFAPTNDALTAMENDPNGKKLLDNPADRKGLLKRLILLNTVLLTNLTLNQKYEAQTALPYYDNQYERVRMSIFVTQSRSLGKDASINIGATNNDAIVDPSKSEFGGTNGIVYTLDKIPYSSTLIGKVCLKVLCDAVSRQASMFLLVAIVALGQVVLRTF